MVYIRLVFAKAFGPTWTIVGVIAALAAPFANSIWGSSVSEQYIGWSVFGLIALILCFRLFFLAPYQLWVEANSKIASADTSKEEPPSDKRQRVGNAAAAMLSSGKRLFHEWASAHKRTQPYLSSCYHSDRLRFSKLADTFIHHEELYQAAQDAMNRCDIMVDDTKNGTPDQKSFSEANEYTKKFLMLLLASNDPKL